MTVRASDMPKLLQEKDIGPVVCPASLYDTHADLFEWERLELYVRETALREVSR